LAKSKIKKQKNKGDYVKMGKKNLLNENTITRFMKLAAINENAAQAFVGSIYEEEEELAPPGDELGDELPAEDELAMDDELPAEDELGDEIEPAAEGGVEGAVKDMTTAVVDAIAGVADGHGVDVDLDVAGGDELPAEDEMAMGDELPAEDEMAMDDEMAMGDELPAEESEEDLALETRIREIVSQMLNEDEAVTEGGCGDNVDDELPLAEGEEEVEEDDLEESHGRGQHETSAHSGNRSADRHVTAESVQIVDDGILVQEVTNKVFTRLQKMLNERKKAK